MLKRAVEKDTLTATFILFVFMFLNFAWLDCIVRFATYPRNWIVVLITVTVVFIIGFVEFILTGRE